MAAFHKTVSKLFRDKPAKVGTQGLLSKDGRSTFRSTREQLQRFTTYFAEASSGEWRVTPEQQQQREEVIAQLETVLVSLAGVASTPGPGGSSGGNNGGSSGGGSSRGSNSRGGGNSSGNSGGIGDNDGSSSGSNSSGNTGSSPPSLEEAEVAIAALRNAAAAGDDDIVAPLLKADPVMAQRLRRVIVTVLVSGKAPVEFKRALVVPLFKGKGSARDTANHRPISLLSIPGKVYSLILLHHVSSQVDKQLLKSQCAFRIGRVLSDATYTLQSFMYQCHRYQQLLHLAFVDLCKAYDSIHKMHYDVSYLHLV